MWTWISLILCNKKESCNSLRSSNHYFALYSHSSPLWWTISLPMDSITRRDMFLQLQLIHQLHISCDKGGASSLCCESVRYTKSERKKKKITWRHESPFSSSSSSSSSSCSCFEPFAILWTSTLSRPCKCKNDVTGSVVPDAWDFFSFSFEKFTYLIV